MIINLRILSVLCLNFLGISFLGFLNDWLAAHSLFLFYHGLFLLPCLLLLPPGQGLLCLILTALFLDAPHAYPFGYTLYGYVLLLLAYQFIKDRVKRDNYFQLAILGQVANFVLFIVLLFNYTVPGIAWGGYFLKLFVDLSLSQLFLLGIAPLFYYAQKETLLQLGFGFRNDSRMIW